MSEIHSTLTSPTQIENAFNKQFTNTVKHKTHKTNKTHRQEHTQTADNQHNTHHSQVAIKQSKNNNSTGPDKVNIRHLKHIGPLGLAYLTNMYNTSLNNNIIPHTWKLANIIPIPKPNKDMNIGTSYRSIDTCIRHSQHTHTNTQTTPNKHPTHHCQIHRKLHQRLKSIHHIQKQNINTPIQKWCSTGRRAVTHTLQHIRHHHNINTQRHKHS